MNLLQEPWISVRTASGAQRVIAPHQLTEQIDSDPILRLDSPRPDFNGALAQFLIGLVQTAWVKSGKRWNRDLMLLQPPSPAALQQMFQPLTEAFEFDGDGPRFMQDLTLCKDDGPAENGISALLIDTPGERASECNTDHFVKRGGAAALCRACAAMALFTLMTNAPGGGAGHRTSLRGGGPLTTLLLYKPETADAPPPALWRTVASNVRSVDSFLQSGNAELTEPQFTFPWLAPISELQPGKETQPLDTHPCQMFWAMPRRIRLDYSNVLAGECDLCGQSSERLITRYVTKNYGLNYKGPWRHPLSPYYRGKSDDAALPMHPQPGGLGYRHWLGWVLGVASAGKRVEPASVVSDLLQDWPAAQFRLWAFGFDMDNMKPRCWYEATFPLFALSGGEQAAESLCGLVERLLQPAEFAAMQLRWAVRDAWFGGADARGDLSFVEAGFWSATERDFFELVREAAALVGQRGREAFEASDGLRRRWLDRLRRAAFAQFDLHAGGAAAEAIRPERLAAAHQSLHRQLTGNKFAAAAGLSTNKDPEAKASRKARKSTPEEG